MKYSVPAAAGIVSDKYKTKVIESKMCHGRAESYHVAQNKVPIKLEGKLIYD